MIKKLLILLVLLITGCTTQRYYNNILSIDRDGEAEIPGHTIYGTKKIKELLESKGNLDSEDRYVACLLKLDEDASEDNSESKKFDEYQCRAKDMDIVFNEDLDRYQNDKKFTPPGKPDKNKIVIYIHGGLNYPSSSVEKANDLTWHIEQSGYVPYFIDWRSGFISTYKEHLFHDRQGEYYEFLKWGWITFPFILAEDIGRGLTRAPMRLFQVVNNYGKSIFFGKYGGEKNAAKLSGYFSNDKNLEKQCDGVNNNILGFGELPKICDVRSSFSRIKDGAKDLFFMGNALPTAAFI